MSDSSDGLTFGFDVGIGSVGFAAVDFDRHEVVHLASHLFAAPEVAKTRESAAAKRRQYRSQRRRIERARVRKSHIRALLIDAGLVPSDADGRWFEVRKGDLKVVELRAAALDQAISSRDLARILYHFACSRQYIDHGLGADDCAGGDEGKVLGALKANREEMEAVGARTWGELLYRKYLETGRSTNSTGDYSLCVSHELVRDEARYIVARQRELGGPDLPVDVFDRYLEELSWLVPGYDRDLKVYASVGRCTYFPDERRAASACLTSEMEVAAERLAHVRLMTDGGSVPLMAEAREAAFRRLFDPDVPAKTRKLTFRALRRIICEVCGGEAMGSSDTFSGVDPKKESGTVVCSTQGFDAMQRALGAGSPAMRALVRDRALYDSVAEALTFASSQASYLRRLDEMGGLEGQGADLVSAIRSIPCANPVFDGYGARSRTALDMLLGSLTDPWVDSLHAAEEACGLYAKRMEDVVGRGSLLPPFSQFDPDCTNPVVLHAAARFRKAFNEAVRIFGKPDTVRIELARELRLSRRERAEAEKGIARNRKANEKARGEVSAALGIHEDEVSGHRIALMRMWGEQGGIDIYTGRPLDLQRVLDDRTYAEVDYILPWSRSFDDSRLNKVLVHTKSNRDKGARTPYEWMRSGEVSAPDWEDFSSRVRRAYKDLKPGRVKRLLDSSFSDRDELAILGRTLNDAAYMSRRIAAWVEASISFADDGRRHVFAVSHAATAEVSRVWGLRGSSIDEERRPASCAAVIAACTPSVLLKCSRYAATRLVLEPEAREEFLVGTKPWPGYDGDVRAVAGRIVPTRSVSHDLSGQATQDTIYSIAGRSEAGFLLLDQKGGPKPSSTALPLSCGGARALGGIAFIRLWLDSEARPKGKVKGEWLVEPVYYSDIPKMKSGVYVPRYCKRGEGSRDRWPVVPERVLRFSRPVAVFRGDAVRLDGEVGRFTGYDVNGGTTSFEPVCDRWPKPKGIKKYGTGTRIEVVDEDPMGLCWDALSKRMDGSELQG